MVHAMATIQIRHVPDWVHRKHRERAAAAGQSLQEYLRRRLEEDAARTTPAELVSEIEREMAADGGVGRPVESSADIIRAERDRR